MKRLSEIAARLAAATPPDKWLDPHAPHLNVKELTGDCWGSVTLEESDYLLMEQAPVDLALLLRIVRIVAISQCEYTEMCLDPCNPHEVDSELCRPCWVRRELEREG